MVVKLCTGPGEARPLRQVKAMITVNQSAMGLKANTGGARSRLVGWPKLSGLWPWPLAAAFIGQSDDASNPGLRFVEYYLETTSLLILILLCGKSSVAQRKEFDFLWTHD